MRPGTAVVAALLAATIPRALVAAPALSLSAELGPELDTNAHRTTPETGAQVSSPLLRATLSAGLKLRLGLRHVLTLDYGGGAKVFMSDGARSADEGVQLGGASWGIRTGRALMWVSGTYYDAFQRVSVRDFRSGSGSVGVNFSPGGGAVAQLSLGYRGLEYKPLPAYSFHGLTGSAQLGWRLTSGLGEAAVDWDLRVSYAAGLRVFAGDVTASPGRCQVGTGSACTEPEQRTDLHHGLRAEIAYQGPAELSFSYLLEANRSNSYGESYTRHALALKFTAHLVWGIYLAAKGTLQLSRFDDPYLVSEVSTLSFLTIDDENRSSLVLQLARDLGERFSVLARYGLYVNESSAQVTAGATDPTVTGYLRHTVFLGVRFEYSR